MDLSYTDLKDTYLGVDLSDAMKAMPLGIHLRLGSNGVDLTNANFQDADLSGVDLLRSHLSGADLSGAKLTCVHESDQKQKCTNLSYADLTGAKLHSYYVLVFGANSPKPKTDLHTTNLSGADLSNAKLVGWDLSGADLSLSLIHI